MYFKVVVHVVHVVHPDIGVYTKFHHNTVSSLVDIG